MTDETPGLSADQPPMADDGAMADDHPEIRPPPPLPPTPAEIRAGKELLAALDDDGDWEAV